LLKTYPKTSCHTQHPPTYKQYTAKYARQDPQNPNGWWVSTKDKSGNFIGDQAESYWWVEG